MPTANKSHQIQRAMATPKEGAEVSVDDPDSVEDSVEIEIVTETWLFRQWKAFEAGTELPQAPPKASLKAPAPRGKHQANPSPSPSCVHSTQGSKARV